MPTIKGTTLVNIVLPFHNQGFKYFLSDCSLFVPDKQLLGRPFTNLIPLYPPRLTAVTMPLFQMQIHCIFYVTVPH
jgi:hypothetical protein